MTADVTVVNLVAGRRGPPLRDGPSGESRGTIWRYRVGTPQRDVPRAFCPWQTWWKRHRRYCGDGMWDRIHAEFARRRPFSGTAYAPRY